MQAALKGLGMISGLTGFPHRLLLLWWITPPLPRPRRRPTSRWSRP